MSPLLQPERRSVPRFTMEREIELKCDSPDGPCSETGHSRDVSAGGIFLYVDSEIPAASPLELRFRMPTMSMQSSFPLRCLGKIVRVEKGLPTGKVGLAVAFERIDILAEA